MGRRDTRRRPRRRRGLIARPPADVGARRARRARRGRRPDAAVRRSPSATHVWADIAPRLYAQAAAAQWDPAAAIDWDAPIEHPDEVEDAVVQVMTYLIENEQAALVVPARFLGRVHPHFREVLQLLAVQAADEARHIEVFTRRAGLPRATARGVDRRRPGVAADAARRARLRARRVPAVGARRGHLPQPALVPGAARARSRDTRRVARLARQDEARHVAFGLAHLEHRRRRRARRCVAGLRAAVERRHDALRDTAGLNDECSTRWSCSPPGVGPGRDRARLRRGARAARPTWTRAAGAASCASASRPARRPSSPRSTRATSCDADRVSGSGGLRDPARPHREFDSRP